MATSAERMRAWQGPAILTFGFRPFFLLGALWAALAMALWIGMLAGVIDVPTAFDPVSWHAHEMLFGYLNAIVAGFLLTAVPNWTGRLPITGWPLAGLVMLWIAGRLAMAVSAYFTPLVAALIDLAMPMQGFGLRIGLAAALLMIAVVGGRIVPSFTRNWLVKRDSGARPAPPMGRYDILALAVLAATLLVWVAAPRTEIAGGLLLLAGTMHAIRLVRWSGFHTTAEPLVWVLHAGYGFVPLGLLASGFSVLVQDAPVMQATQHLWMAGAIGLMTLAVMTRATLGHTGRPLSAGPSTTVLYALLISSVFARLLAGYVPDAQHALNMLAGLAWISAFGGFAVVYGPMLLTVRKTV
jgi:uncharacterized protein involved in response to NO